METEWLEENVLAAGAQGGQALVCQQPLWPQPCTPAPKPGSPLPCPQWAGGMLS